METASKKERNGGRFGEVRDITGKGMGGEGALTSDRSFSLATTQKAESEEK